MAFRTNKTPVLQEKSASGSVATFNTALAMPLASCNIAVNAWQEGSGDPSPDNVRNIVPRREVNITQTGKNIKPKTGKNATYVGVRVSYDENEDTYTLNGTSSIGDILLAEISRNNLKWKKGSLYTISVRVISGDWTIGSGTGITFAVALFSASVSSRYIRGVTNLTNPNSLNGYTAKDNAFDDSTGYKLYFQCWRDGSVFNNLKLKIQIEVGNDATDYAPYITPEVKTIDLGEDTYGAVINTVDGGKDDTHVKVDLSSQNWGSYGANRFYFALPPTARAKQTNLTSLCSCYKREPNNSEASNMANLSFCVQTGYVVIRDDSFNNDLTAFVNSLTGQELTYELATPVDGTPITPTPITTFEGDNTIFADTGDVDLTYKDLDIAKRGNFREVFKLPS